MTNKRTLKKQINLICEELFAEFIAASLYGNNSKEADVEAMLFTIAKLQEDFVSRISHPEPGMSAKQYYQDLRNKFSAQVSEILDQINNL